MSAYYNESDPKAATWLRQLIVNGDIPAGEVDERDIRDVRPDDLRAFRHLHLFAGIGGWALALRFTRWPDDRPVLTVSCPCPSFSAAGTGSGFADERHLWPAAFWLIDQLRPPTVMGEQVEAAVAHGWLDLVCDDLEGIGYATRPVVLPACSVGAPHFRNRLWFVADTEGSRHSKQQRDSSAVGDSEASGQAEESEAGRPAQAFGDHGENGGMADAENPNRGRGERGAEAVAWQDGIGRRGSTGSGAVGELADTENSKWGAKQHKETSEWSERDGKPGRASPWDDLAWLPCRDGKARPTQSGILPLVNGLSRGVVPSGDPSESEANATAEARVMRLKGYGNAIVPQVAAEVIRAYLDTE